MIVIAEEDLVNHGRTTSGNRQASHCRSCCISQTIEVYRRPRSRDDCWSTLTHWGIAGVSFNNCSEIIFGNLHCNFICYLTVIAWKFFCLAICSTCILALFEFPVWLPGRYERRSWTSGKELRRQWDDISVRFGLPGSRLSLHGRCWCLWKCQPFRQSLGIQLYIAVFT